MHLYSIDFIISNYLFFFGELLENEVQIAENQKDTSLVVRLKKRVCELKGLHSRKMKEVAMKNNEVRELRNTQKRSTQMKHEIESLRHRQAAQGKESLCFFLLLFSFLFFFFFFFQQLI